MERGSMNRDVLAMASVPMGLMLVTLETTIAFVHLDTLDSIVKLKLIHVHPTPVPTMQPAPAMVMRTTVNAHLGSMEQCVLT